MNEEMVCPNCGGDCARIEVDIGVGIQYGPWGCPSCGWSESTDLDNLFIEDPMEDK